MTRNMTTIGSSESCRHAVAHTHRAKVRHLPVADAAGRLVRIVTDRDLRHRRFAVMEA